MKKWKFNTVDSTSCYFPDTSNTVTPPPKEYQDFHAKIMQLIRIHQRNVIDSSWPETAFAIKEELLNALKAAEPLLLGRFSMHYCRLFLTSTAEKTKTQKTIL